MAGNAVQLDQRGVADQLDERFVVAHGAKANLDGTARVRREEGRPMSRASRARRVVTAAAFGGGSLGALSAALFGLIYGESKLARRRIAPAEQDPPRADGIWTAPGVPDSAPPLVLAMLGDSSAAGYGVHVDADTPAARSEERRVGKECRTGAA